MSKHLFGLVVTPQGVAANNRGENEGNITTLQKILWSGEIHTTVSAEAIRWAVRYYWQRQGIAVNWQWNEDKQDHQWQDPHWSKWSAGEPGFIDDDVLGFMLAEGAKSEGNEAEGEGKGKSKGKAKGTIEKRRGLLEVSRAISLTPFAGDITFNAKSGEKGSTSLYGTEVHATRYQYGFALTPEDLRIKARALDVVDAIVGLGEVAGNHSRFLYDFAPDVVVFRWTDDASPRMLYGFEAGDDGLSLPEVLRRVAAGDIDAEELVLGGSLAATSIGEALKAEGATVVLGVKEAARLVKERMRAELGLKP
jgi:CRISPR-associated protein Cst2